MRDYVKPGTSALFMMIEKATPDKAIAALDQYGGTVIKTSLSDEDTAKLQEALRRRSRPPSVDGLRPPGLAATENGSGHRARSFTALVPGRTA